MLQVRVRFSSTSALPAASGAAIKVSVARLALEGRGAPPSSASRATAKPASIEFHGRYLRELRKPDGASFELFATLPGSLMFEESTLLPLFEVGADAEIEHVEPQPEPGTFRQLKLEFDPGTFTEIPSEESTAMRLRLPTPAEIEGEPEPLHFELTIVLKVAGADEAALGVNDVLDVPLQPIRVGLVIEWPTSLDESVPTDLLLVAKQGGIERKLEWLQGESDGERRRFLFRGILGPAPVDLSAVTGGKTIALWEAQDITRLDKPNVWKNTLEDVFASPPVPADEKKADFVPGVEVRSNVVSPTPRDFGDVGAADAFKEA